QAGKAQLARFYYIKLGNHPLNQRTPTRLVSKAIFVQAFAYLVDWVENGNEPGPLPYKTPNTGIMTVTESCTKQQLGDDACACFNASWGSAVCTNPPPEP